jgi:hypothetical protein
MEKDVVFSFFVKYTKANELEKLKLIESLPIISTKKDKLEKHMLGSLLNSYLMDMQDYYEERLVIDNIRKQGAVEELEKFNKKIRNKYDYCVFNRDIENRIKELKEED